MAERTSNPGGAPEVVAATAEATVYARIRRAAGQRVAEIMTTEVVTIDAATDLARADALMRLGRFRHLPVVQDGHLVGLVTHRDLLRTMADAFRDFAGPERAWLGAHRVAQSLRAEQIMARTVLTIHPDATVLQAAHLLRHNKFGCLPVLADGRLLGIVTEADFLGLAITALGEAPADEPTEASYAR
ncbi:MAG: CBS domain-containing protein [Proteobacteria bacterium]|nr:CBS domain-containing protein [Pseudomonadota bacterium]